MNATTTTCQVWMRLGDQGEYENFDAPFDAGSIVGGALAVLAVPLHPRCERVPLGVTIGPFQNLNYVSLYWGDNDAQPLDEGSELNASDLLAFLQGVDEGIEEES